MKKKNLRILSGVIAVSVTPYKDSGKIDLEAMTQLASRYENSDCDAVFVAGSSGDMPLLSGEERIELTRAARLGLREDTVLLTGVSDFAIESILNTIEGAKQVGADAAVVMTPMMFHYSPDETRRYFETIANRSSLPIILYHHLRMPTPLEIETVVSLAAHENIVGLKETGVDQDRFTKLIGSLKGTEFPVFQGCERFVSDSLLGGAAGLMTAMAAVFPEQAVAHWNAFRHNDLKEFERQNAILMKLNEIFSIIPSRESMSYFTFTLKTMLVRRGWLDTAAVRMPGFTPSPSYKEQLCSFLNEINFPRLEGNENQS